MICLESIMYKIIILSLNKLIKQLYLISYKILSIMNYFTIEDHSKYIYIPLIYKNYIIFISINLFFIIILENTVYLLYQKFLTLPILTNLALI